MAPVLGYSASLQPSRPHMGRIEGMNRQIRTLLVLKVLGAMAGAAFAATPITFEENRGQASRKAAFVSRGAGYHFFLTAGAAVIAGRDGGTVRIGLRSEERRVGKECRS